ncbi:MAG: Holliday junction resolvase [Candidatus Heimdallarchaeota archaeon]|nr:Holliday junction resolvase [Candidatus Heimdallarchaeota archaeon]MCK5048294.1 Holliday junction resolvase [Candidatus Heimdallarchaeota archaeon]
MLRKSRGTNAERDLVNQFWENDYACIRSPSSGGGTKYPRPDLIAGSVKYGRTIAIELKTSRSESIYIQEDQIKGLKEFANTFGAEIWFAVKFIGKRTGFRFFAITSKKLHWTRSGNCKIDLQMAKENGLPIETFFQMEDEEE